MFTLKHLYANNFKSYREIKLENLDQKHFILISAPNGYGKSCIRHLLEYLLTDTFSEDIPLSEVTLNKEGNCLMRCVLERDNDGAEIEIVKYREHKKYENKTFLSVNGDVESFTYTDRRETQKKIEELFGIKSKQINISTIFSQNSESFPSMKEVDRKKVIYDALGLSEYLTYHNNAKAAKKKVEQGFIEKEAERDKYLWECTALREQTGKTLNRMKDFESTRKKDISDLENTKEECAETDTSILINQIKDLQKKILPYDEKKEEEHIALLSDLQIKIAVDKQLKTNLIKLKEEFDDQYLENYENLEQEKIKIESVVDVSLHVELVPAYEESIKDLEEKINMTKPKIQVLSSKIQNASDGICPILQKECEDLKRGSLIIQLSCQPKLEKLEKERNSLQKKLKVEQELFQDLKNKIEIKQKQEKEIEKINFAIKIKITKNELITKRKNEIEKEIKKIGGLTVIETNLNTHEDYKQTMISNFSKIQEIKLKNKTTEDTLEKLNKDLFILREQNKAIINRKVELGFQITKLQKELNPFVAERISLGKKLNEIKNNCKEVEKQIEELITLKKYYDYWITGYGKSGIPNMKSESFLESIEEETNKILSRISDRMSVKISSQSPLKNKEVKEKISYEVLSPEKPITGFFSYSSGQRQRVLLADKFAFNKILGKFNFIILDEVLSLSLDDNGKTEVLDLLTQLSSEIQSLFVIDHDSSIKDKFDNVISMTYKNGLSELLIS